MTCFDRLERRWGWLAFPGFLRYYALFHVLVFVLELIRPDIGLLLAFDRGKILSGEIWRVATMFFSISEFGSPRSFIAILLLVFAVNFAFMISDGLESVWGVFKTSLFYYTGILLVLLANFVYPVAVPFSGAMLYASAILAFATLLPKVEILLYFILPVQMRFIGILTALGILFIVTKLPILLPFVVLALANYFIWAGLPALRGTARVIEAGKRRRVFNSAKVPASEAFHTCAVCHKTDVTDPHTEFRIGPDGEEYCSATCPMSADACRALADGVLVTHVAFVAFVVGGLLVILGGGFCGWKWIRNPWFRAAHLAGIGLVIVQAWLGIVCPLTVLEMHLRDQAGDATYNGTFIAHWLRRLLFYDAPPWVFAVCYTLFGLAVIGSWWKFRPRPFRA